MIAVILIVFYCDYTTLGESDKPDIYGQNTHKR